MKSESIKRAVHAKQPERAAGDAPNLGRIARMPGTGLPKGSWRKRRGSRREKSRSWSLVITLTALVILGLLVWLWLIKL